jgi:predicted dehydrogenase
MHGGGREIGIGVLGYEGAAKAHLQALLRVGTIFPSLPVRPVLVALSGRTTERVREIAARYGAQGAFTDWQAMIEDPRLQVLINAGPNDLHAGPSIAAAARGLHVLCEKPLARTAPEAQAMRDAVARAGIVHMAGYNYRFVPAVLQARRMIEAGELGQIYHLRTRYCDDSMVDPAVAHGWRHERARAGSGVLGDLAAHAIDMARFLGGEISAVGAATRIFIDRRPRRDGTQGVVDVEDAVEAVLEFASGAIGTLEASTFCPGRKNFFTFEISGSRGTLAFNLERLNELELYLTGDRINGFRTVLVTEGHHPYGGVWWPPGHILGWEQTFVHQLHRFLTAVGGEAAVAPEGATFDDGYRCAAICELLERSSREGRRLAVQEWKPEPQAGDAGRTGRR